MVGFKIMAANKPVAQQEGICQLIDCPLHRVVGEYL
jgi:hypothetical protein